MTGMVASAPPAFALDSSRITTACITKQMNSIVFRPSLSDSIPVRIRPPPLPTANTATRMNPNARPACLSAISASFEMIISPAPAPHAYMNHST